MKLPSRFRSGSSSFSARASPRQIARGLRRCCARLRFAGIFQSAVVAADQSITRAA
jgi:hypothetical protein